MKKLILIFSFVIFFTGIGFTKQWIYHSINLSSGGNQIENVDNSSSGCHEPLRDRISLFNLSSRIRCINLNDRMIIIHIIPCT